MHSRDPASEALNVYKMGKRMISIIKQVREKVDFEQLDMRIGLHTVIFF